MRLNNATTGSVKAPARAPHSSVDFVRSASLRPFITTLHELGAPVERCLSEANLPRSQLANSEALLSLSSSYRFLDIAARREGLPDLGVAVARRTSAFELGQYGILLSHSATVNDYLERGIRYVGDLSNRGCLMWLTREGDSLRINQRLAPGEGLGPAIADAYTLVLTISTLRKTLGEHWFPSDLSLRSGTEQLLGDWLTGVNGRLHTQQSHSSFTLHRSALCLPVSGELPAREDSAADRKIPDMPASFLAAVEYLMDSLASEGTISIDTLAESMGSSARQLQRRLTAQGCSYRMLLTRGRVRRAQEWLRSSELSVAEIAAELGYTDASNFARAFRKASGLSPAEYRKWHSV
jgi:AraC-like DNA-binding protein